MRLLLIQVRERVDVEQQERQCFIERCGLRPEQLESINLVRDPQIPWHIVESSAAVLIGGAGVYSVTREYPFNAPLTEAVQRMYDEDVPLFGACWGHQFIARALGGEVVTDASRGEAGTHEVDLTQAGLKDALFAGLPPRFAAHMGHNDHVTRLPDGAVELATSPRSANQAFRVADKPMYGTQFHVELSTERLIERLTIYQELYMPADDEFAQLRRNPQATPHADGILRRFLDSYARDAQRS